MVFAIIFAFSYLLYWDVSEAQFKAKQKQVNALELKIKADKLYLQNNPQVKINMIEKDIKLAVKKMLKYKDNNEYIKNKIEEISSLIYDEQTWGEYLHSISKYAKNNKIKLLDLENRYTMSNESFGHVLDINIKVSGGYKNTINFINSLEQSDLVVDLHTLNMEDKGTLYSDLNISVWGIRY
jgi:hypothetical protein